MILTLDVLDALLGASGQRRAAIHSGHSQYLPCRRNAAGATALAHASFAYVRALRGVAQTARRANITAAVTALFLALRPLHEPGHFPIY